jgi:hypothetical protein
MEKVRDFIPKTYMPILFGSIILAVFGFLALLKVILSDDVSFKSQFNEIKSLKNSSSYLIPDTLIIDSKEKSDKGGGSQLYNIYLKGRLKSDLNLKRTLFEGSLSAETSRNKSSRLHFLFNCKGCIHEPNDIYIDECECLPVLRSNLHNEIYANNPYTLEGESTKIIMDIIMETYLFWIVPFLFFYYKITQLLYHYLDRKIKAKKH